MRTPESPSKVISISLDQETLNKLEDMACCSGRSRSCIIKEAINDMFDQTIEEDLNNDN